MSCRSPASLHFKLKVNLKVKPSLSHTLRYRHDRKNSRAHSIAPIDIQVSFNLKVGTRSSEVKP